MLTLNLPNTGIYILHQLTDDAYIFFSLVSDLSIRIATSSLGTCMEGREHVEAAWDGVGASVVYLPCHVP